MAVCHFGSRFFFLGVKISDRSRLHCSLGGADGFVSAAGEPEGRNPHLPCIQDLDGFSQCAAHRCRTGCL